MNLILKNARESKGLKTREVAQILKIDQALISKFESGTRKPTKEQILKLASLLEINQEELLVLWLKEKILHEIKDEKFALDALKLVENDLLNSAIIQPKTNLIYQKLCDEIDLLKQQFKNINSFDLRRITKQIELEFVFECNRINGNSMNYEESKLVINEGVTIEGKAIKEHLEIINFYEALQYCKELALQKTIFNEKECTHLHNILLRGLKTKQTDKYAEKENNKEMELFFKWLEVSKNNLSPIILASESHLKIMSILPFHNYNNQMALLIMNLLLIQNEFYFALIKGDSTNRENYITILEKNLNDSKSQDFTLFIAQQTKSTLNYSLSLQNN